MKFDTKSVESNVGLKRFGVLIPPAVCGEGVTMNRILIKRGGEKKLKWHRSRWVRCGPLIIE